MDLLYTYLLGKMINGGSGDSGMANPMTTAGDIIVGGASGTPTRLAMGTAGQFLCVNTDGTAVEWTTVPDAVNQGV